MLYKNLQWQKAIWVIPVRLQLDGIAAWKHLYNGDPGFFMAIVRSHVHFIKWILFIKHDKRISKHKSDQITGLYHGSIVWDHFIKKKNSFLEIIGNK
jgi:hypothetical protein